MGISSFLILALTIFWLSGYSNSQDIAKGSPVNGEFSAVSTHGSGTNVGDNEQQLEHQLKAGQDDQDDWSGSGFVASRQLRSVADADDDSQMRALLPAIALRNFALLNSIVREPSTPLGNRFPMSAWSKRFYTGDNTKRQNHSYRKCFFNPIACFRK